RGGVGVRVSHAREWRRRRWSPPPSSAPPQPPNPSASSMNARLRNPPLYNIQHHAPHSEWLVMDEQEKRKLDRKRARNRAAATKCRQKKIDRIQELEGMVRRHFVSPLPV
ncbi:hypothetical protein OSTOST_21374, partial [Ostertagia ostertagi]